ncbi:hypothetical protein HNY73_014725 [Argiope bruennichi]|uniref:Uncharacterized protein n=1 Tax=Argiope bruennichi TaxID=94029 RepID=A0A8T0EUC7_ARGBR|nr:hypothetical protein HNY73_014725 [Argiope bruennichi]
MKCIYEAFKRDERSDDSSSCKSSRSKYPGSFTPTEFMREINQHCTNLRSTYRNLKDSRTALQKATVEKSKLLASADIEDKQKWIDEFSRRIHMYEERLKNAKPCIRRDCYPHEGNKNLCALIKNHQTRIQRLNSIALTFIETLKQMKENHLELTAQYFDDNAKLQEIQADIKNLKEDLNELGPCPIPKCDKHTPDSEELNSLTLCPAKNCNSHTNTAENTHMEIEQPFQVVEKRHVAKRKKKSADSQEIIILKVFWTPARL